ncbi:MAG: hopanoid biosynthesis-associated protein HpnK [Syntrophobacteraceae bacterium]
MGNRYLIVNSDDFGFSREVNQAVVLAFRRGILTSASLMAGGAAFRQAVILAHDNPQLAVGIHITCVNGRSVLPAREIPHLVDRDGNFPSDPGLAGLKYFFCKRARKELFREFEAQFEKFLATGLACSHIDSHCHMHVNPAVFEPLIALGARYGIRRMRVPEDDFFAAAPYVQSRFATGVNAVVFKLLTARMKPTLRKNGFRAPLKVYGNFLTGSMGRAYMLSMLEKLPAGVSEIYCHPALLPGHAEHSSRELQLLRELGILLDTEVRSKINRLGITPATYFDLDRY